MPITTAQMSELIRPGLRKAFGESYKQKPKEWTEIFDVETSKRAFEEILGMSTFGLAQIKPQGASIAYDSAMQGFKQRFDMITYGLGFILTREMAEDNLYQSIGPRRAKDLARSMRVTQETVCANILNRAFNSSYLYADGVELCSTVHPNKAGGTWRNELATAADLSESAIEQAFIDIANFKDDRGKLIGVMPTKLIVPRGEVFNATRILESVLRVGTGNNDINAIRANNVFPDGYVVNHWLTDEDAWFIKTDCPTGLLFFRRRKIEFAEDDDFDTENAKFKSTMRFAVGAADPRGIFGSPGA